MMMIRAFLVDRLAWTMIFFFCRQTDRPTIERLCYWCEIQVELSFIFVDDTSVHNDVRIGQR